MGWNYRVLKRHNPMIGEDVFGIHEVYYREDDSIQGWSEDPVKLTGESMADLAADLLLIGKCFDSPVIDISDEDNPREITKEEK